MQGNRKKTIIIYAAIIAALFLGVYFMSTLVRPAGGTYKYSDIIYMFNDGVVKEYTLDLGSGELTIKLDKSNPKAENIKETATDKNGDRYVVTHIGYLQGFIDDTREAVEKYNVENVTDRMEYDFIPAKDNSWVFPLVSTLIMVGLMVFLFFMIMRQSSGGGKINQFSKANTKTMQSGKKTTFADVAGADEEKEELSEIVEFLKKPEKLTPKQKKTQNIY